MLKKKHHNHTLRHCLRYTICVSGSADLTFCSASAGTKTVEIGREIARQGCVLVTGATTGIPALAAKGCKEADGFSIGLSPAFSQRDHIQRYKLPTEDLDLIIYTGFDYAGRNLFLTRAADAVIISCGRIGTLNEFTIAFEERKPIGVLRDGGGAADMVDDIIARSHKGHGKVIYDDNPVRLVRRLLQLVEKEKVIKQPNVRLSME